MGGTAANRVTLAGSGIASTTLGSRTAPETVTLTGTQNGPHKHPAFIRDDGHKHPMSAPLVGLWCRGGRFFRRKQQQYLHWHYRHEFCRDWRSCVRDAARNLDTTDSAGSGALILTCLLLSSPTKSSGCLTMANIPIRILRLRHAHRLHRSLLFDDGQMKKALVSRSR